MSAMPQLMPQVDNVPRPAIKGQTGLLKVPIGTRQKIKDRVPKVGTKKGTPGEAVEVKDLGQYPESKVIATCLTCRKNFKTEKELVAAHPTAPEMAKANVTHVWGFWSDDKEDPADEKSRVIGLLSDLPLEEAQVD